MINLDDELATEYLSECCEHLATMESALLDIEKGGTKIDAELVNRVFRAVHSVKGGAGFFDLMKIRELAHQTEDVLCLIRSRKMVPTPDRIRVLLRATDKLNDLIRSPETSNQADIAEVLAALAGLCPNQQAAEIYDSAAGQAHQDSRHFRVLLVEDDFASRLLLQTFLSRYGECHVAVNGKEAVEGFRYGLEHGQRYGLICMDIMMPEMDGREAVRQIRALEEEHGFSSTSGTKIFMTTAVTDVREVIRCFKELCDGYLMKPIDLNELLRQMRAYQLVQ
jgi:two-component system, chemotaxis family, chemotaxis protein CheY